MIDSSPCRFISFFSIVLLSCLIGGCRSASDHAPRNELDITRSIKTFEQLARQAVVETRTAERVRLFADLIELLPRYANDEEVRRQMADYIIGRYWESMQSGAYARWKRPTPQVDLFAENFPRETVVLGLTKESDWVRTLDHKSGAFGALEKAGALDTVGVNPFQYFRSVQEVLDYRVRGEVWSGGEYDNLIGFMYTKDKLAAGVDLLNMSFPTNLSTEQRVEAYNSARRQMATVSILISQAEYMTQQLGTAGSATTPRLEPSDELLQALRTLARRPEWSVHLFLLSEMGSIAGLQDRVTLELLKKHQNPVTKRFMSPKAG